jgi:hypothetical protein
MRNHELHTDYQDHFEYFGNTEIERIRKNAASIFAHIHAIIVHGAKSGAS